MSYQDLILAGISLTNVDRLMTLNRIDNALNLNVYRKSINNLNFYSLTTKQNPEYLSGSIWQPLETVSFNINMVKRDVLKIILDTFNIIIDI